MPITSQTGYIYILTNSIDDTFYIGSTTNSLETRFKGHCGDLKSDKSGPRTSKLYTHYDKLGWNNVKISLLENVNYTTKTELEFAEARHILPNIRKSNCLNTRVPLGADNLLYIKPSTIINSPTDYVYRLYLHSSPMRKVFTEFKKYCKPYYTVLESFTRIRKSFLIKQIRKVVPRINKFAFEAVGTVPKRRLASVDVPAVVPTKSPTNVLVKSPVEVPKKRGRPPKETPTSVPKKSPIEDPKAVPAVVPTKVPTAVPTKVPVEVPMSSRITVPRTRGRPKKGLVPIQKYEVIPLTEFAK